MFYDVTTKDDPIIEKLAVENTGDVYATGHTYIHTYIHIYIMILYTARVLLSY